MKMKTIIGLTKQQVLESRRRHGDNVLTPPPRQSLWSQFIEKFSDPLIKILLVALALSVGISLYEMLVAGRDASVLLEPLGILIAVTLATLVGFAVEVNANKKFELLNRTNDEVPVKVLRDGHATQVARRDIVVGDVVILDTGDSIPADGELLKSVSMSVDESSLTGEPLAWKSTSPEASSESTYPVNELLRGTHVVEGNGVMRVTRVGDRTEYGKVFTQSQIESDVKTPLMLQFDRLGKVIAYGSYAIAALIILGRLLVFYIDSDGATLSSLSKIQYYIETIMLAVTLVVVSVPEGLPMSVTLSLALSMRRMLRTNNLVRKMHACETMGATTVICTDKTGTLTQNQMQVVDAGFSGTQELVRLNMACNSTAFLDDSDPTHVKPLGNPTEGALLLWLREQGHDYMALREKHEVLAQLPFSTERKYMATVVRLTAYEAVLLLKGAPEIVAALARHTPDEEEKTWLHNLQNRAMRTLAFAMRVLSTEELEPLRQRETRAQAILRLIESTPLHYDGAVAISDPVREGVPASIADCRRAGIEVKIVTGDNAATAREVGRQVGLWSDAPCDVATDVITGPEFAALPDDEAAQVAKRIKIMARARPTDKARLVTLLQAQQAVVAVTGDGTNDAPALNLAQVGLSMGDGTAAAKQASDITILDNSFTSINKAVLWGRSLYRNIQRFILFQLTVNVCACLVVALCSFFSTQQVPLNVTQMLWVNLIMDTFAALALASLPPNSIVMRVPPRRAHDSIITPAMSWFVGVIGVFFAAVMIGLFYLMLHHQLGEGGRLIHASIDPQEVSIYFSFFVFLQFWNLFNAKSFGSGHSAFHNLRGSKVFFLIIAVIFVGQILIVQWGGAMFGVAPMTLRQWLIVVGATMPVMLVGELWHAVARLKRPKPL